MNLKQIVKTDYKKIDDDDLEDFFLSHQKDKGGDKKEELKDKFMKLINEYSKTLTEKEFASAIAETVEMHYAKNREYEGKDGEIEISKKGEYDKHLSLTLKSRFK